MQSIDKGETKRQTLNIRIRAEQRLLRIGRGFRRADAKDAYPAYIIDSRCRGLAKYLPPRLCKYLS